MSKIGKLPVKIEQGVTVEIDNSNVKVTGPKGTLNFSIPKDIEVIVKNEKVSEGEVLVKALKDDKITLSKWGTVRKLIDNMVKGVTTGWQKKLELIGTGYRAEVQGNSINMIVGYSHPIKIDAPEGITFKLEKNVVTVDGIDRQVVGQVAANIRSTREPEPYQGKGVKYIDEVVRRKAGKAAKAAA